jgi:hypothetical protein
MGETDSVNGVVPDALPEVTIEGLNNKGYIYNDSLDSGINMTDAADFADRRTSSALCIEIDPNEKPVEKKPEIETESSTTFLRQVQYIERRFTISMLHFAVV